MDAAEQAARAGDDAAASSCLAYAATIARRFRATFADPPPDDRIRQIIDAAQRAAPADDDPAVAAQLAAARAWSTVDSIPVEPHAGDGLAAARRSGDPVLITGALDASVAVLSYSGRHREAHRLNTERGQLLHQLSRHDPRCGEEIVDTFHMMTELALAAGALPDALAAALSIGDDVIAGGQPHMAASKPVIPLVLAGRFGEAFGYAEQMWQAWLRVGRPAANWMAPATYFLVLAYGLRGDEAGRLLWKDRFAELSSVNRTTPATQIRAEVIAFADARVALHAGDIQKALTAMTGLIGPSATWYDEPHSDLSAYAWAMAAEVAVVAGLPDAGRQLTAAEAAGQENDWAGACLARARGRRHGDPRAMAASVAGWEAIGARFERACTLLLLPGRAAEGHAELAALGCPAPAG